VALTRPRHDPGQPIQAAGAVLWRPGPDGPELALIHRPRYDDWSFPKGKLDPGEHAQLAAVREVHEETGHLIALGRRLPTIAYEVNGMPKRVRYWAGRPLPAHSQAFEPNDEVDRLAWLTPGEGRRRLSRQLDVTVLDAFLGTPSDTTPIVLLRHGAAKRRGSVEADDRLRPLSEEGVAQSGALVPLLSCFGPLAVVSSPAVRCVDTIRPYAGSGRAIIDIDPALSQEAHAAAPRTAASWMRALISEGRPVVVCSHRPVLDGLLAAVLPAADAPQGPHITGRPWSRREADRLLGADRRGGRLPAGNAWVLHFTPRLGPRSRPRLIAVDRLRP
jgi:8-oxo-dGTP diphosphatase